MMFMLQGTTNKDVSWHVLYYVPYSVQTEVWQQGSPHKKIVMP